MVLISAVACSPSEMATGPLPDGLGDPIVPTAGNVGYDATSYSWDLTVDPATGSLEAETTMIAVADVALDQVVLDYAGPAPLTVTINGSPAEFHAKDGKLVIDQPVDLGSEFNVEISYAGTPSPIQPGGFGPEIGWLHQGDRKSVV